MAMLALTKHLRNESARASPTPTQLVQNSLNPVPGFLQGVVVFNKTSKRLHLLLE